MGRRKAFETAVFTDAKPRDLRARWALFLFVLLAYVPAYWILRDVVYSRKIRTFAQGEFNKLASATIEKLGSVSIDRQGDVTIHDGEAWTRRDGEHRLFFKAKRVRLTLDGVPFRDEDLRIMRIDLDFPEIWVRRETDGVWNVEWALGRSAPPPDPAPSPPPVPDGRAAPDPDFPRNGVHIHDGIVHVTLASRSGRDVTWTATGVRGQLRKSEGVLRLDPFEGDFYGGRIAARAEVPRSSPFTVRQLTVRIADADVARLAEGTRFADKKVSGRFNGVLALAADPGKTGHRRPIAAGRCEITDGNLWEFPAFSKVLSLLTLQSVVERRIDSAILEFTIEEQRIRIDQMHFLGHPVSLFGDGQCGLTGDWMEVVFIPRLGKSDWNSILPVIGIPLDLLGNLFKGLLVPVVLTGSFDDPKIGVDTGYTLQSHSRVEKLIQEKAPK